MIVTRLLSSGTGTLLIFDKCHLPTAAGNNHDSGIIQARKFLLAEYHLSIGIGIDTKAGGRSTGHYWAREGPETPCAT